MRKIAEKSSLKRTVSDLALPVALLLTLGACTAEVDPRPASSATPPVSSAPVDPVAAEMAALPVPVDAIRDWADSTVANGEDQGYAAGISGWLSEHSSRRMVSTDNGLPVGKYRVEVACRGESTITVTFETIGGESMPDSPELACSESVTSADVTTDAVGLSTVLELDGDPSNYAVSYQTLG